MNMESYYPPLGYSYRVEFSISSNRYDVSFQSVSGLSVEYDFESYKEGGENRFEHKLPVRTKYSDLVLRRGMLTDSDVINWFKAAFQNREFQPADVTISLLNEKLEILRTWVIVQAIPKKWQISDFSSTDSAIVVETIELTYRYFTVQ
jgi:phage tail-like protein